MSSVASTRRPRSLRAVASVLPWLAAGIVLGLAWLGRGYTADDAFITGRYALRLAAGQGYTFRDGPATDGVTGPALLGVEVPAALADLDPVDVSKGLGALSVALAVWLVARRLLSRATGTLAAGLLLVALAGSGALAMHAQNGLETGLVTLLVTVAGLAATSRAADARRPTLGVVVALLLVPWLRPELVPLSWALAALWASRRPEATRRRSLVALAVAAVIGLGSIIAFRAASFGHVIPLSAQAKPTDLGNGLGYTLVSLAVLFGLALLPALHAARTQRVDLGLGLALCVTLATATLGGGDWMPGGRLLVPVAPLVLHLFAIGLARFARTRPRALLTLSLGVLMLAPQLVLTVLVVRQAEDVARSREHAGRELRTMLDRDARVVALIDLGFLSYRAPWQPFDLAGVTDPDIGTRPGAHCAKPVTVDDLLARDVDTIVLHSGVEPRVEGGVVTSMRAHPVEQALAADARVRELFEVVGVLRYAPGYYYVVLRRRT